MIKFKSMNSDANKNKIFRVLDLNKREKMDIPFIVTYKNHEFEPELEPKHVWKIFELDYEFEALYERKNIIIQTFDSIKNICLEKAIADNISYKFILNAMTNIELNDMDLYNNYLKEIFYEELKSIEDDGLKIMRPVKTSIIQNIKKYKIDLFVTQFSLRAYEASINIENLENGNFEHLIKAPTPAMNPENLSREFLNNIYDNELKVMTAACKFLALEYFSFPYIREIARKIYKVNCCITTEPTEEGKIELNPFNPSFRVKRINGKAIETFNDDLFLDILENEKKNLIKVEIFYNANFFKDFTEKLNLPINGENEIGDYEKNGWRVMREESLRILVADYCIPYFEKEIRVELQEKAEQFVIKHCTVEFEKVLKQGPYRKHKENNKSEIFKEEEYPKVISFVYDNAKQCVFGVFLNEHGEIIESHEYYKILQKPTLMMKKEEKDEQADEQNNFRYMILNFKPDLIVISANDLKCQILKEQLLTIGEELKRGII